MAISLEYVYFGEDGRDSKACWLANPSNQSLPSRTVTMELLRERKVLEFDRMSRLSKVVSLCRLEPLLDRHPYDLSGGAGHR